MRSSRLSALLVVAVVAGFPQWASAQHTLSQSATNSVSSRTENAPVKNLLMTPVTIDLTSISLSAALDEIARVSGIPVLYSPDVVPVSKRISVRGVNVSLGAVLAQVLRDTDIEARVTSGDRIMLTRVTGPRGAKPEQGVITGRVMHAKTKQPIAAATVLLDDAVKGVTSNDDGTFRMPASVGEHTVTVRMMGFTRQAKRVTVIENQSATIELWLTPSASVLNEVIVTGSVVATERKTLPNPITVITAEDIEKRGITRVDQLLRGEVPGVISIEQGSTVYASNALGGMAKSEVYARGSSGITSAGLGGVDGGKMNPLKTYIDGVELLDPSYLGTIDPKNIERIEIITGPQAATVYGSGAMGGVMQIFTKKGIGRTAPDLTLAMRYGVLENNIASNKAPTHNHVLSATGGAGPEFSYSGNLSYIYSGQWRPLLFNRSLGVSAGATHARGSVTASGSVMVTNGLNGTYNGNTKGPSEIARIESGEWNVYGAYMVPSQTRSKSYSQTATLSLDYRPFSMWHHRMTIGTVQTNFALAPMAPVFSTSSDTLFYSVKSNGRRLTQSYDMTLVVPPVSAFSSTLTFGISGSQGEEAQMSGCIATKIATSLAGCYQGGAPSVYTTKDDRNWGSFGRAQIGLFDQLFLSAGLRGERSPNYGRAHKVDWTPTSGITYTAAVGDLTAKFLASYGRATRAPNRAYREQRLSNAIGYAPSQYVQTLEAPDLLPERSRGPEGGLEIYYGNLASFTVNHYQQKVDNLIEFVKVDSMPYVYLADNSTGFFNVYRYMNTSSVRQWGWESTASLTLGAWLIKGTYSWNESRIYSRTLDYLGLPVQNESFAGIPTHTGNITIGYAQGRTSVTLVTNIMGQMLQSGLRGAGEFSQLYNGRYRERLTVYSVRQMLQDSRYYGNLYAQEGYAKSDLAVSHRLTPWSSLTLNVINLGNSYGTDGDAFAPALGRQTTFGVSLRLPQK